MRSTWLFAAYALLASGLVGILAGLMLYSIERNAWWDDRTQLAQRSYGLHLRLEADVYRLFKQHGDALLIGDRDGGQGEAVLKERISGTIRDIRDVISQEIMMVGDEEIEELEALNEIERDIRAINAAVATLSVTADPVETLIQIERVAALLDEDMDVRFNQKIEAALAEELEEVEEVLTEAAQFRAWNQRLVYLVLVLGVVVVVGGIISFNLQLRRPLLHLNQWIRKLKNRDYRFRRDLGGCREFAELTKVLGDMAEALQDGEIAKDVEKRRLEASVSERTAELQQSMTRLRSAESQRDRLLEDLSHELRAPIAKIQQEVAVLSRTRDVDRFGETDALERIDVAAGNLSEHIDTLLGIARQDAKLPKKSRVGGV